MAEDQAIVPIGENLSEIADIRDLLSFRLHRLNISNDRLGQRLVMERFGLSLPQWRMIGVIGALGPNSPVGQVLETLSMNKSQLSREFKTLAKMGLVISSTDSQDHRRLRASLTERGLRLHEEMLEFAKLRSAMVIDQLSPENASVLVESMEILIRWIEEELVRLEKT